MSDAQRPRKRPAAKKAPPRRQPAPPRSGRVRGTPADAGAEAAVGPPVEAPADVGTGQGRDHGQAGEASEADRSAPNPLEDVLRFVGQAAQAVLGQRADERIAEGLAFLRRRLTGDYDVDLFGFDKEFSQTVLLPLLRPLYKYWFRVEVRGAENIPAEGAALLVANHSGTIPIDSLMTQMAVHDAHPAHRHLRMLGADLVFRLPLVADVARKSGTTLACNEDTERLLTSGELVGVWPEGFKGIGKPFAERYKLQRFGRGGFVSAAIRAGSPIVPCSIVGAEEIYPLIGSVEPLARLLGLPYVPVTPTFPWLGPLGLIPLPSKWIIQFGSPIPTDEFGAAAAEDPMLVFDLTDRVRETIQHTLYTLLTERGNPFR